MIDEITCCANCKYWYIYNEEKVDEHGEGADGECRRYPPNVPVIEADDPENEVYSISEIYISLLKDTPLMTYPFTFAGEWCGEFKMMDKPRWTE